MDGCDKKVILRPGDFLGQLGVESSRRARQLWLSLFFGHLSSNLETCSKCQAVEIYLAWERRVPSLAFLLDVVAVQKVVKREIVAKVGLLPQNQTASQMVIGISCSCEGARRKQRKYS